jgi:hypothetical protein
VTHPTLQHWARCLRNKAYADADRHARAEFARFRRQEGGDGLRHNLLPPGIVPKTALIASLNQVPLAKLEGAFIKAFQAAGFETVILGNGRYDLLRYYRLAGAKAVVTWPDFGTHSDPEWVAQTVRRLSGLHEWLALTFHGVHVGRFAVASAMRSLRRGQLDFTDRATQRALQSSLLASVGFALSSEQILARVKPDCVLLLDRGYVGQGELFDSALARGVDALTWNGGHKSNRLFFKRYTSANERDHHASLSNESWARLLALNWTPEHGRWLREELFRCYEAQDWFSFVGTQFGKTMLSREPAREQLGLDPNKKVAVIFPHILWDGSFFWGEDLFDDYTHWFAETIRAAADNPRLEWIIKLHPSHVVKAHKDNITTRPDELDVIANTIGELPNHVKLVRPESALSTFALFGIADYAITVRGTVGIEASLFGIPVLTAGTGRYAGRGFTIDSSTREEYLERLRSLEKQPRLSPTQIELAERYAVGVFLLRPLDLKSVSLEFERDAVASWKVAVHCRTREAWLKAVDIQHFAEWVSGHQTDMFNCPPSEWPWPTRVTSAQCAG